MPSLMTLKKALPGNQPGSFRESFISVVCFYKVKKQMTTTLPSGKTVEYIRNKFTPVGAWDLTTEEGKNKFIEHTFKFEDNE